MGFQLKQFISVDVETSGPVPAEYSLLQIGACLVSDTEKAFSCFVKPVSANFIPEALEVTGLDMKRLLQDGLEPQVAMSTFAAWIESSMEEGVKPVFVGLNAAFDWSFVNFYFHRYFGANPFGHSALDIKSLFMGSTGCNWSEAGSREMAGLFGLRNLRGHDALHDALFQAELFRETLVRIQAR